MYYYLVKLQGASSGASSMNSGLLGQLIAESLFKASGSGSGTNVNCAYSSNPTSANLLCYLYCMIQPYYGLQCLNGPTSLVWTPTTTSTRSTTISPQCPYITDPESTLACQMYYYLTKLQVASSGGSSTASGLLAQLVAESLFKASGSGSGTNVNCAYSNNPTSANLLCYLYCMIQPYYGLQCLNGPTSLMWTPTSTGPLAITTSPACPYITDPESTLACQMYYYLVKLQGASSVLLVLYDSALLWTSVPQWTNIIGVDSYYHWNYSYYNFSCMSIHYRS